MKKITNSTTYIICYAMALTVIVAFALAFVSQSLKAKQEENVALDKKKQILYALNIRDLDNEATTRIYKETVVADAIIDEQGQTLQKGTAGGEADGFKLNGGDFKAGKLALFICNVEGKRKYVIPVYGMGLWGGISGYIALDEDKSTVYGAYCNHESETAGLGAEIKDSKEWQDKFCGKRLFAASDTTKIALAVAKKVEDPSTQVDGITGATLTSNGVTEMLQGGLTKYMKFLSVK